VLWTFEHFIVPSFGFHSREFSEGRWSVIGRRKFSWIFWVFRGFCWNFKKEFQIAAGWPDFQFLHKILYEISHQFSFVFWNIQQHIFASFSFSETKAIRKIHQTISRRFFIIFRRFSRFKVLQCKNQRLILNDSFERPQIQNPAHVCLTLFCSDLLTPRQLYMKNQSNPRKDCDAMN
jgi:hypothetical protein